MKQMNKSELVTVGQLKTFLENANDEAVIHFIVDGQPGAVIWEMWNTDLAPIISIQTQVTVAQDAHIDWQEPDGAA